MNSRRAEVFQHGVLAGILEETEPGKYRFSYLPGYRGAPVSLTLPISQATVEFERFPSVFEGLLPEGIQLEAMLRRHKLDRSDLFGQLTTVGADLVGSLTIRGMP